MSTKHTNISQIREMLKNMSLSSRSEFISTLDQDKEQIKTVMNRRNTFIQTVTDWGYSTPTDFLIECEFIPNPTVKRPRTVITDDLRQMIISDLKLGTMTSKEVSGKHHVPVSSVDNIKGDLGLTKQRKKMDDPTPSSPPSVPSVVPPTVSHTGGITMEMVNKRIAELRNSR